MVRLVVFDLDGTLIDSRRDIAESGNALLAGYGALALPEDAVLAMVGEGARTLVSRLLAAGGVGIDVDAALGRFLEIYAGRLTNHTDLYPGVRETLEAWSGRVSMAVLTNKPQVHTDRLLDHFDVSRYFCGVLGGDTAHGRKPDPSGLHALCERAGAAPDRTLMVGDSWVDIETARRAGARACFADYGFGLLPVGGLAEGELRIETVGDLTGVLASALGEPAAGTARQQAVLNPSD